LGFARGEWDKAPSALSGGEQTRAALARMVVSDPDLILLDEPTNHLDIGAIEWLEKALGATARRTAVASHDRTFLDAVADRIWEIRDRRLAAFPGRLLGLPPAARDGRCSSRQGRGYRHGVDRRERRAGPALSEPSKYAKMART
jgi:ATPase subunit of ABC transporter with duplicated ATPase domains